MTGRKKLERRQRCYKLARYGAHHMEWLRVHMRAAQLSGGFCSMATMQCECHRDQLRAAKADVIGMFEQSPSVEPLADRLVYGSLNDEEARTAVIALEQL